MFDPTTLQTKAEAILAVLEDAAQDIGWEYSRSCVTAGPQAVECDSIFVWADAITPIRDQSGAKCHVVHRVRFQYVIAPCTGTVPCEGSDLSHDRAWYVQTKLIQEGLNSTLCDDPCSMLRFGDFTLLTNDGGFSWWQGSIQVDMSPEGLFS